MANSQGYLDPAAPAARQAGRALALMLVAAGAYTLYSFTLLIPGAGWQLLTQTGVMTAYCGAVAAAWWLARRGRIQTAGQLTIGALWLTTAVISAVLLNLGLVMGLIASVLTMALVAIMMTGAPGARTVWLGLLAGGAILLADLYNFWPWLRLEVPALRVAAPVIAGLLGLAYVGLVARQFSAYSLRTKLLLGFVLVVALAVGALELVIDRVVQAELTTQAGEHLQATATNTADEIAVQLERQISLLQTLSLNRTLQDGLAAANAAPRTPAEQQALDQHWRSAADTDPLITRVITNTLADELRQFQAAFPENAEVFITDRAGAVVAASQRTTDYDQSDELWWQTARQGNIYIGQPEYDTNSQALGLSIALPVLAPAGAEILGVARITLGLQTFADPLINGQFGETGSTLLFLPNHWILKAAAGSQNEVWMEAAPFDLGEATAFQNLTLAGTEYLVSHSHVASDTPHSSAVTAAIAGLGWQTAARETRVEALRAVDATSRATLTTALAVIAAAALAALVLAQLLTRPLVALTAVAARVSGGELHAQAPVESADEIGALATTFNVMTTQLRETLEGLEQRVADRTRALAASAEVSRRLAAITDEPTLVRAVVDELQAAFGFYYAHIYLWDAAHTHLVMAGGTGEAGQIMLARGHRLPRGRGLVGQAAETNAVVLVPDTAQSPTWVPNPLLPETRAEAALPIAIGEQVLGVLDVQQNRVGGLTLEDAELLQAIANQVAIALLNARAAQTTQAAAAREAQLNALSQRIRATSTVEDALQVAVRELGRAAPGARARVALTAAQPAPEQPESIGRR